MPAAGAPKAAVVALRSSRKRSLMAPLSPDAFVFDRSVGPEHFLYEMQGMQATKLTSKPDHCRLIKCPRGIPDGLVLTEVVLKGQGDTVRIGLTDDPGMGAKTSLVGHPQAWSYDSRGHFDCAGLRVPDKPAYKRGDTLGFLTDWNVPAVFVFLNGKFVGEFSGISPAKSFHVCAELGYRGDCVQVRTAEVGDVHRAAAKSHKRGSAPAAPVVTITDATTTTVTLGWTIDTRGSVIKRHILQVSADGGATWERTFTTGRGMQWKVTALAANCACTFRVKCLNAEGWSEFSAPTKGTTLAPLPPPPPQLVTTQLSSSSLTVGWGQPPAPPPEHRAANDAAADAEQKHHEDSDGGAPVLSYKLQMVAGVPGEVLPWKDAALTVTIDLPAAGLPGTGLTHFWEGLSNVRHYAVRVRALR